MIKMVVRKKYILKPQYYHGLFDILGNNIGILGD